MFYLVLVVLLNTLLSAEMKLFAKYKIDALQTIVVNYWVCVITGSIYLGHNTIGNASLHSNWFVWALLMGCGFISIFNLLAYCTRVDGITTTTVANKLSLVIPVCFSLILYHEHANAGKIIGILIALPAVYLSTRVKDETNKIPNLFWPVLLFVGSGLLDTLVKYVEHNYLPTADVQAAFTIHAFAAAGSVGIILIIVLALLKKIKLHWRNLIAGICVGIPNYFSIYFLIRMLNTNFLQSSAIIPVNNIAIVVASTLMAILFFKEKITVSRAIGIVMAIAAILLIAFADMHGRVI
ncbi:MAG: DMT family transporter [Bacteroidetes bacterium]|nr:DMT family transporter [Bacteroidota bacterium]